MGKKFLLNEKKDEKTFEYLVKDKNPELKEKEFNVNRDAGNIISFDKNLIPNDYENIIKNYFLNLNKQDNKGVKNEREKK